MSSNYTSIWFFLKWSRIYGTEELGNSQISQYSPGKSLIEGACL